MSFNSDATPAADGQIVHPHLERFRIELVCRSNLGDVPLGVYGSNRCEVLGGLTKHHKPLLIDALLQSSHIPQRQRWAPATLQSQVLPNDIVAVIPITRVTRDEIKHHILALCRSGQLPFQFLPRRDQCIDTNRIHPAGRTAFAADVPDRIELPQLLLGLIDFSHQFRRVVRLRLAPSLPQTAQQRAVIRLVRGQ